MSRLLESHSISPIVLAGALVANLATGCNVGQAKLETDLAEVHATPLPVQTVPAEVADLFAHYQATSNIAADGEAEVPARVSGEVIETLVEEGDRVRQGQLLARVDGKRLQLRMLNTLAQLGERQSEYDRQRNLHERGLVSSASYESLKYDVDELKAAYELGQLNLSYAEIRAPIDGTVSDRYIRAGQHVQVGELTFRITDTSRLVATLLLPQLELARFRAGQGAVVTVDACPGEHFDARIERISPTIDKQTGTFRATVYIKNDSGNLVPGMFARFRINYEKFENTLVVPAESVVREDDELVVYRIRDGVAQRQAVVVGVESDGRAQILSGLDAGDEIIVSAASAIQNGTRVLARNDIEPAAGG